MKFENIDISSIDFGNLALIKAIDEHGSLSQAALVMGMSQSTASYNLDKMRTALQDPLFQRVGRGLQPTEKGKQLAVMARIMLDEMRKIEQNQRFDPHLRAYNFVIGASLYEGQGFLADMMRETRPHYPKLSVDLHSIANVDLVNALQDHWDFALTALVPEATGLRSQRLFRDDYVTYYDPSVRAAPDTLEAFVESDHIVARFGLRGETVVDRVLRQKGFSRRVKLTTPGFDLMAPMMLGTQLITTLPRRLSTGLLKELGHCPCPLDLGQMACHLVWARLREHEPAHLWLRERMQTFARSHV